MSYLLDGTPIRNPQSMQESNSTITAQQRTLDGGISRDHMGSNKRVWALDYQLTKPADFQTIDDIYRNYLATNSLKTFEITEPNYTVSETLVHVDLQQRSFSVRGESYLSDFTLILTEA